MPATASAALPSRGPHRRGGGCRDRLHLHRGDGGGDGVQRPQQRGRRVGPEHRGDRERGNDDTGTQRRAPRGVGQQVGVDGDVGGGGGRQIARSRAAADGRLVDPGERGASAGRRGDLTGRRRYRRRRADRRRCDGGVIRGSPTSRQAPCGSGRSPGITGCGLRRRLEHGRRLEHRRGSNTGAASNTGTVGLVAAASPSGTVAIVDGTAGTSSGAVLLPGGATTVSPVATVRMPLSDGVGPGERSARRRSAPGARDAWVQGRRRGSSTQNTRHRGGILTHTTTGVR